MTQENGPRQLRDPLERSAVPGESSSGILADRGAANPDPESRPFLGNIGSPGRVIYGDCHKRTGC
jgi:hypothetical protein